MLQVQLAPQQTINSSTLDVRLTEATSGSYVDSNINLQATSGWQQQSADGTTWSNCGTPSNGGNTPVRFRMLYSVWDTTKMNNQNPLGQWFNHNDNDTATVAAVDGNSNQNAISFGQGISSYQCGPAAVNVTVANMVFAPQSVQAGSTLSPDYFGFDPTNSALQNPEVNFEIQDSGDTTQKEYDYTVTAWSTDSTLAQATAPVVVSGTAYGPGQVHVVFNDTDPFSQAQSADLVGWGTYTFEIKVEKRSTANPPDPNEPSPTPTPVDTLLLRSTGSAAAWVPWSWTSVVRHFNHAVTSSRSRWLVVAWPSERRRPWHPGACEPHRSGRRKPGCQGHGRSWPCSPTRL